jgi:hypothetical protein
MLYYMLCTECVCAVLVTSCLLPECHMLWLCNECIFAVLVTLCLLPACHILTNSAPLVRWDLSDTTPMQHIPRGMWGMLWPMSWGIYSGYWMYRCLKGKILCPRISRKSKQLAITVTFDTVGGIA